jgi:hypothetical protein
MPFVGSLGVLNSFDVGGGNREDLLDIITNISPMDTILLSSLSKTVASNIQHEWLTDILASFGDPDLGLANVQSFAEGSDANFSTLTPRKRLCNLTHILRRTFDVSDTQRDINTAGIRDEYAYQGAKASKELARFIEYALVHSTRRDQTIQGNNAAVLGRRMDGIYAWATASDPTCSTSLGLTADEMGTVTEASGMSPANCLDECLLNNHLEDMWAKGAMPDTALVNSPQKRAFDGLVLNPNSQVRYNIGVNDKTVVNTIDFFQSSFGTLVIKLHRYQARTVVYVAEKDKLRIAVLRPVLMVELAKLGSSSKGMIEWEGTLECLAPNAVGMIDNLCVTPPDCR